MRTTIISVLIALAGITALYVGTDGWRAWTAESARRLAVARTPIDIGHVELNDTNGGLLSVADYANKLLLVEFIFTRCPSMCQTMGAEFRSLEKAIQARGLADRVHLISVSFDGRDTAEDLREYLKKFRADPNRWTAASVPDSDQLDQLLDDLGVVVIPEENVGFIHNSAVYVVDNGKVASIKDFDDRQSLINEIRARRPRI